LAPFENQVSTYMTVYEIQTDSFPQHNRNDFIEAFWLMPEEAITGHRP